MALRIHAVGGLGEFGTNCLLLEDGPGGDVLVLDAGAGFPRDAPGTRERMLPDPDVILPFADRVKGYIGTHGHEDHVGAIPWLCARARAPVYGAPTTLALIRERCDDAGLPEPELVELAPGGSLALGGFEVRALAVSHSIPDSLCLWIRAGGVTVVHSGDFRVDRAPLVGPPTDMAGLEAAGLDGVDVLLVDSTGATTAGHNPGEASVLPGLERAFAEAEGRLFITTFSSHVQRILALARLSARHGRRVALAGRGVVTHARIAGDLGHLRELDGIGISGPDAVELEPARVTVVLGGCQGEEGSALWRLVQGDHRMPPLQAGDTVVHSARVVPGAEARVAGILDRAAARGAHIVDGHAGVHVSGHGFREDLRALISATHPRCVIPIHGGQRHLHACADLARSEGLDADCVPLVVNGDVVEVAPHAPPRVVDQLAIDRVLVDDDGSVTPMPPVLTERRDLAGGLVVVSMAYDMRRGVALDAPRVSARGLTRNSRALVLREGVHEARVSVEALAGVQRGDVEAVEEALRRGVRRVLRRHPGGTAAVVAHVHAVGEMVDAAPDPAEGED